MPSSTAQSTASAAPKRARPPLPASTIDVWSLTRLRTGELLLQLTPESGRPGLSTAAVRLAALIQARRHASTGEKVLVSVGQRALYLYHRRGFQVPCAGCRKWTQPAKSGRSAFCGRCRRIRRERAEKRKAARAAATCRQLELEFSAGDREPAEA